MRWRLAQAVESRARYAHHFARVALNEDRASNDRRIAAELTLPERVTQHGDRFAAGRRRVGRLERAAERRIDAEHTEIVACDEQCVRRMSLDTRHQLMAFRVHITEYGAVTLQLFEFRP
jgi:hypothetical protein